MSHITYQSSIGTVFVINADTFDNFRKNLRNAREKERKKLIGFTSTDDELARKILEKEKIDIYMPLFFYRKDRQKQRDSGFDHVMAKIARKNNVTIGVNLSEVLNSHGKEKAEILARIRQNIKLCNKNNLKMIFLDTKEKNPYDLKALGLVLGMPTWMTREI